MIDSPRLRLLIGRHGLRLAAAIALVGLLSVGAAGWIATSPSTETVQQEGFQQEVVTSTTTSTVVTGDDSLWPPGTELRDKPVYLFNASSTVTVTAETTALGAEEATVSHEWLLTIRATSDDEEFYAETETLAAETHEGTTARTSAELNASELRQRIRDRQRQIGDAGTVSATLTLVVEYETDRYEGSTNLSTPIRFTRDSYALQEDLSDRTAHSTTIPTTVDRPPNRALLFGLAGFGLIALAAAGGIVYGRPDTIDLEEARNDLYRRQYAQWISPGIIPDGLSQAFLEVESLEDVVDVAIDTNERVIHDTRRNVFAVISDNVVYYYSIEGSWEETVFPRFDIPVSDGSEGGIDPFGSGDDGDGPGGAFGMEEEFPSGDGEDGMPDASEVDEAETQFDGGDDWSFDDEHPPEER